MTSLYEISINTDTGYRFDLLNECESMINERRARNYPIINYRLESDGIKYCKNCKTFKLFEHFHRNRSTKWGIASHCKDCSNENSSNAGKYKNKYTCGFCDFTTPRIGNLGRHLTTQKHIKKINLTMPFCEDINIMICRKL